MSALLALLLAQDVVAQECRPRDGLPRFFAKADRKGAELKVAYFQGTCFYPGAILLVGELVK